MDDISESIEEIYEAVGDPDRWQRLSERLAERRQLSPEIEQHFETARRVHEQHVRLIGDIETLASIYDQLAVGALVVDRDALLLRANAAARQRLGECDGLELVENRVRARDPHEDALLRNAIARQTTGAGDSGDLDFTIVVVTRPGKQPLSVLVLPSATTRFRFFEEDLPVTLFVIDPDQVIVPASDTLRGLYGFTAREAEFAAMLMRSLSVKEAAVAMGVSMTTARTFLAQITAKTDSHSQAELMVRLLATPRTHSN